MAEYISLGDYFKAIGDAIREKKGTSDKIKPIDFPSEIASIEVGGGADVVTVSFYNYDGSLLYQKPTIKGDDCVDVVAKGLINPTKPSDNYNNYTLIGWSKENDNSVDSDVLKNINEDINVYACYQASTRYYTVNFYSDGTLFDTVQVTYGQKATHKSITKNGYKIGSYEPSNEVITADTDINIVWVVDDGIIRDTWETVIERAQNGTASTYYKIGNIKDLEINYLDGSSEVIPMRIVQFNPTSDDYLYSDTSKHANVVFLADKLLKDDQTRFKTNYINPFGETPLYEYLNNTLIDCIPTALKDGLLDVVENDEGLISYNKKGKIWIPNKKELTGTSSSNSTYTAIWNYSGQKYSGMTNNLSSRIRCKNGSDEGSIYCLRDNYETSGMKYHLVVKGNGDITTYSISSSSKFSVLIGFCI